MTATRLPVRSAGAAGLDPALVPGAVDDRQLDLLDGDRVGVDGQDAGRFARRRAQPAGELREVVRRVQTLDGACASRRRRRARSTPGSGCPADSRRGRRRRRSPCTGWPGRGRPRERAGRRPGPSHAGAPRPVAWAPPPEAGGEIPRGWRPRCTSRVRTSAHRQQRDDAGSRDQPDATGTERGADQSRSGRRHCSPRTCSARNAETVSYQTFTCPGVRIQWFSSGK